MKDIHPWDLTSQLKEEIRQRGGFVNTHGHFDKAFYIDREKALVGHTLTMEEKWLQADDIKRSDSPEQVEQRVRWALEKLVEQGIQHTISFVDAYSPVGHKAVDAALKVREEFKDKIGVRYATQPLDGLLTKEGRDLYEEITAKADIAGGLPSFDRPKIGENLDVMFSIAKNLDKPVHCHIDQLNDPDERDTEILIEKTIEHGYQGRVTAIHAISISAQPKKYRTEIYKKIADAGISVSVSPAAALSMVQVDQKTSNVHNSIANVPEMLEAGILVGLGVDNVHDYYLPFVDTDMWVELRILMEACRFYDMNALADIASTNGKKIFDIK